MYSEVPSDKWNELCYKYVSTRTHEIFHVFLLKVFSAKIKESLVMIFS